MEDDLNMNEDKDEIKIIPMESFFGAEMLVDLINPLQYIKEGNKEVVWKKSKKRAVL